MQHRVFPFLDEYAYMGVHAAENNKDLHDLLNRFHINMLKTDGLNFDLSECIKDRDDIFGECSEKSPLFSYEYGVSVLFAYPDAVTKAERLHKVFGEDLKIIMIVREQTSILSSQYRDHPFEPHDIHRGKPVSFEKWYRKTNELRYFRFTDLIHYDRLVGVYDDLFGKENVLVLPLELMRYDPELYAQKMGEFLGVEHDDILKNLGNKLVNAGKSVGVNRLRRLRRCIHIPVEFSKILPAPIYKAVKGMINRGAQETVNIPDALRKEIRQRYVTSNKKLEERCGVTLNDLDYSVYAGETEC